jgi:predicted HTH transcriptional regulator
MGKKFENIEKAIRIKNRGWIQRNKGETKQIILNSLKEGHKTAFELRDLSNISIWTAYHHLQQLIKKEKITKYPTESGIFLYKLV